MKSFKDSLTSLPLNTGFWDIKRIQDPLKSLNVAEYINEKALKITVFTDDLQQIAGSGRVTERAEIGEIKDVRLPIDTPVKYSFDFAFPKDFKITNNRLVFAQWKHINSNKSPVISLRYIDGFLITSIKNNRVGTLDFKKKIDLRNGWFNVEMYLNISYDKGFAITTLNGQEIVNYQEPTAYDGEMDMSIFKMGVYRDRVEYPDSIYFKNFTREVVIERSLNENHP